MSRIGRDLAHWERLWHGGHASREQVREAMRELGADESYITSLLGWDKSEAEDEDDE